MAAVGDWYSVFKAKDARFDGRFVVGVASTGIYCRPVCRAKLPRESRCAVFATAAEAERAGFRPCLLCRPELAPGAAIPAAGPSLAQRAARLIEERCAMELGVGELARELGAGDRQLRRAFAAEFRVTPLQYLQTRRLLLAKSLLTDTDLPVLAVAMASGFGSLRRFNGLFRAHYRMTPSALRRHARRGAASGGEVTVSLGYRPPYPWETILGFLDQRAIPGVEAVADGGYWRTVRVPARGGETVSGWIRVRHRPDDRLVDVTLDSALLPVLPQVLGRVRRMFDLDCDPESVHGVLAAMDRIRPGLAVPGTRVPGCFDPFEMAVRAVLGQQITVKGARTLAGRLVRDLGVAIPTGIPSLTHGFPTPGEIAALPGPIADRLGPLGVTGARARTIHALATALIGGALTLAPGADPEAEVKKLLAIPGIGPWTAEYVAMRALGWTDAFLVSDYGVKQALAPRTAREMLALAEAWRPWRSYATVSLWNAL